MINLCWSHKHYRVPTETSKSLSTFCRLLTLCCSYVLRITSEIKDVWCARAEYTRILDVILNRLEFKPILGNSGRDYAHLATYPGLPWITSRYVTKYRVTTETLSTICRLGLGLNIYARFLIKKLIVNFRGGNHANQARSVS